MSSMYEERNLRRALAASVETHGVEEAKRARSAEAKRAAELTEAFAKKRPREDHHRQLHEHGFTLVPDVFAQLERHREHIEQALRGELERQVKNSEELPEVVFNHDARQPTAQNDKRRLQVALKSNAGQKILATLREKLLEAGLRISAHELKSLVALWSLAGCARQPCHTDLDPDLLTQCTDDTMPLLILVALDKDTSLQIWPMDCDEPFELPLPQYSALVFRADLRHAGSAYERSNV